MIVKLAYLQILYTSKVPLQGLWYTVISIKTKLVYPL